MKNRFSKCVIVALMCCVVSSCMAEQPQILPAKKETATKSKSAPNRWAILIKNASNFRSVLVDHYGWDEKQVIVITKPTAKNVAAAFKRIGKLERNDMFLLATCARAARGRLFHRQFSWQKVEKELKRIGGISVVIVDNNNGGLAIEYLNSASIIYSGCTGIGISGGIFKSRLASALTNEASDKNKDGCISLGEAYNVAAQRKALVKAYAKLRKDNPKFWRTNWVPRPVRWARGRDYQITLSTTAKPKPIKIKRNQTKERPQRWALLIHHARSYKKVLVEHYGWNENNIIIVNKPTHKKVADAFARIPKLSRNDLFFFSSCHHAAAGYLFNRSWPWHHVDRQLKRIGATTAVVFEICHAGLAIERLDSAYVVHAACDAVGKCGGIYKTMFVKALTDKASDANKDGVISLGEAFDAALRPKELIAGYRKLREKRPKFWPTKWVPFPVRSPWRRDYEITLHEKWDLRKKETTVTGNQ